MAPQSFDQAYGVNRNVGYSNPSRNQQVDLTLRLGSFQFANPIPMNPQYAQPNYFTGPQTQAQYHNGMVYGGSNALGQAFNTRRVPYSTQVRIMGNHFMNNSNGQSQIAVAVGGVHHHIYNFIPPMQQMNEYTLLNPTSRRGSGSSSSRKRSSRKREVNYNNPNKRCTNYNCGVNNTPMWRKGPLGPKSLCNACGIRYRKEEEKKKAAKAAVENPCPITDGVKEFPNNSLACSLVP